MNKETDESKLKSANANLKGWVYALAVCCFLLSFFFIRYVRSHPETDYALSSVEYEEVKSAAYNDGYAAGENAHAGDYESGKEAGYDEGYEEAKEEYYELGRDEGFDEGFDEGYDAGLREGKASASTTSSSYSSSSSSSSTTSTSTSYVINRSTKKFHYAWCSSVSQMKESNKMYSTASRSDLVSQGYSACKRCCP